MEMTDFLSFRKMITPVIIEIVFWIGVVACVLMGLGVIFQSMNAPFGGGAGVFSGLLILVLGPLGVRIYCELLIVLFRMNETLTDIRNSLASRGPNVP
ncbi:MAG: DUF4282 domain-containing protein [Bryobacteraceae bacterium]